MVALVLLLLRWYTLSVFAIPALAACYFPDGSLTNNDTPCRDDTENSVCCGQGYACLSNGICQATGEELQKPGATEFVRGGCTDKSWRSSSCPLFCMDPKVDNTAGGMGLSKCENQKQDLYYCINSKQEDASCDEGLGLIFFPGRPSAITTIGVSQDKSTTAEISTRTSDFPTSSALSTALPRSSAAVSTTLSPEATQTGESEEDSEINSMENSTGRIVGGVVGGLSAVAVVSCLGWWFFRRRRRHNARALASNPQEPTTNPDQTKHTTWFSVGERHEVDAGFGGWNNHRYVQELEGSRDTTYTYELPTVNHNEPSSR